MVLLLCKLTTWPAVQPLLKPPPRLNGDCGGGKEDGRETVEAEWAGRRGQRRGESQKSQRALSIWSDWENDRPFMEMEKPGEEVSLRKTSSVWKY